MGYCSGDWARCVVGDGTDIRERVGFKLDSLQMLHERASQNVREKKRKKEVEDSSKRRKDRGNDSERVLDLIGS